MSGNRFNKRVLPVIALLFISILGVRMLGMFTKPPANLGVRDGRLSACPDRPNCVCSQNTPAPGNVIEPLQFQLAEPPAGKVVPGLVYTKLEAFRKLADLVDALPRSTIIRRSDDYLHVEFRTPIWGFVDDVEFLLDADQDRVHVRSASRIGYSDFGTNRKRIEAIRKMWVTP